MDLQWNAAYIDLQNLISIARGDQKQLLKYLLQFQELIPARIESLKQSLAAEDRKMIRQILHQMSPQLQFFGIPGVIVPIRNLELEYTTLSIEDLNALVNDILIKLDGAIKEIEEVLKNNFSNF